jgi:hypothetical protein
VVRIPRCGRGDLGSNLSRPKKKNTLVLDEYFSLSFWCGIICKFVSFFWNNQLRPKGHPVKNGWSHFYFICPFVGSSLIMSIIAIFLRNLPQITSNENIFEKVEFAMLLLGN